jgi:flotillin
MEALFAVGAVILVLFITLFWLASRYRRCPSDKILVVYGKVSDAGGKDGLAARCYHGGGAFVWPVVQDFAFLDLTPMSIEINLQGALSQQNIRVNVPSAFTVGISTDPGVMENAAERLLGMTINGIAELAKDLIFGQMRVVIATMPIEEINADRDKLVANISNGVEVELRKVGLRLINVNIQDITDESGYIAALGKDAAARAINDAKIKVAEKERDGEIGKAEADRTKRIRVAEANALAVKGENEAAVQIANSNASRKEREAEATRVATAAEKVKSADALREAYAAEELAERQRAKKEEAAQTATLVVKAEIERRTIEVMAEAQKRRIELESEANKIRIRLNAEADKIHIELLAEAEKRKIELIAAADAERSRITQQGDAEGIQAIMFAKAAGTKAQLDAKAEGFRNIVAAAGGSAPAAQLMLTEQLPVLVAEQVKAVSGLKIDKVTVWDGGKGADGKTATANFLSGMIGSLPPLHEIASNAGVDLPGFLGKPREKPATDPVPAPDKQ